MKMTDDEWDFWVAFWSGPIEFMCTLFWGSLIGIPLGLVLGFLAKG